MYILGKEILVCVLNKMELVLRNVPSFSFKKKLLSKDLNTLLYKERPKRTRLVNSLKVKNWVSTIQLRTQVSTRPYIKHSPRTVKVQVLDRSLSKVLCSLFQTYLIMGMYPSHMHVL